MTADPHTETNADLLKRLYAALKHNKSCSCGECCGGLNAADALAARLEAAERENERLRRERREAVGLALWVAAIESQPIESRVAWVEEMVERYFVMRVQRRAALAGREGSDDA